jgi:hypothetical protein
MKRISLCTVCMNRLQFLSQTLPLNLSENRKNEDVEFLVLDYNSGDNMEDWIRDNLGEHLQSGLLKYYKTYDPQYFHLAHSKNMIMRLATADIIGMIDADNFAGPDYATWVEETFRVYGPNTITTTLRKNSIPYRDQGGKICFSKDLFYSVCGFDEELIGYGMDDVDLANRLENAGGRRIFLEEEKYLKYIGHSDAERLKNYRYPNLLESVYYQITEPADPSRLRVLYLFKDGAFSDMHYKFKDELKNNLVATFAGWTMERREGRKDGQFQIRHGILNLFYNDASHTFYKGFDLGYLESLQPGNNLYWKEVFSDDDAYMQAVLGFCECQNRLRYLENDRNLNRINEKGWGKGTVYFNFDKTRPIQLD